MLSTILKQRKINYYNHYFQTSWNSIRNPCKGLKDISAEIPNTLIVDATTISNVMEISNIFNNYFSSIASKTKLNISFSQMQFLNHNYRKWLCADI